MCRSQIVGFFMFFWLLPVALWAEDSSKPLKPVNPVGANELASVTLGLLLVLALVFALAWLYRRYGNVAMFNRSDIQILGGVSLGSREKAVLLEVDGTRLLVGVAAGQVNTLHVFDQPETKPGEFADKLQQSRQAVETDHAEPSAAGTLS